MSDEEIPFLHFWRPDWCPFEKNCRPKVTSNFNDICFGADNIFRFCINFDFPTLKNFWENHNPDKSAIAFISLSRSELLNLKDMIEDALKYSTGVDTGDGEIRNDEFWKIKSKQTAGGQNQIY